MIASVRLFIPAAQLQLELWRRSHPFNTKNILRILGEGEQRFGMIHPAMSMQA